MTKITNIAGKFILLLLLTVSVKLIGASADTVDRQPRFLKSLLLTYEYGKVLHTHSFVKGDNPEGLYYNFFQAFSVKYGINTDGRQAWQQLYGYPVWGFGVFKGYLVDDNGMLGSPTAFYAFFQAPFKRWNKWSLNYEIDIGFAVNWNRHDIFENGYDYPIGTYGTAYFAFSTGTVFEIDKQLDLSTSIGFTHFSNGAIELPNLGINLFSSKIGLQYHFKERTRFIKSEIPKYIKETEWLVYLAPAVKQIAFTEVDDADSILFVQAFSYPVITLSTTINRQLSNMIKIGIGFDLTYNGTHGASMEVVRGVPEKTDNLPFADHILIGIYPAFELVAGNLSMIVQPGFYVVRKEVGENEIPASYQKIGMKYQITKHLFVGANIRAYSFKKADFIEWVMGYRLKWQD